MTEALDDALATDQAAGREIGFNAGRPAAELVTEALDDAPVIEPAAARTDDRPGDGPLAGGMHQAAD